MARKTKPLTDTEIKAAKPKDADYQLYDGDGLTLLIKSSGSKLWQFRYYRPLTKQRTKQSFGAYPAVLAIERKPCETSTPPKPARLSAAFTVWLFIGWLGLIRLGKINSRPPLRGFIISRIARAPSDSGTVWSRFIFIRAAGIFHSLALKSISSHRASAASAGRVMVRSCHMNRHLVDMLILAVRMVCISCGS